MSITKYLYSHVRRRSESINSCDRGSGQGFHEESENLFVFRVRLYVRKMRVPHPSSWFEDGALLHFLAFLLLLLPAQSFCATRAAVTIAEQKFKMAPHAHAYI
ncbi:hypothetical protein TNIN_4961 [Trichonephila inaurata madagascariensis]|uniref:Uncharacterized protein n=1 Tax=Trichonephila inaurata madagascariensis TaxID=2747483 RepID=A0A8X6Y4E4_9ARAC|nr:hypothetical protein TNIN_4961 [Trichonephila inaurata madagascariensis]